MLGECLKIDHDRVLSFPSQFMMIYCYPMATSWTIGVLGFDFRGGGGGECFSSTSRPERLRGPPSLQPNGYQGLFLSGRESDHSPPSSADVKELVELYLHSPICLHGVVLS
jgi:hypothetical protein